MSDTFHEQVPDAWLDQVFAMMWNAQWHTFQVLTKRADRMHAYLTAPGRAEAIARAGYALFQQLEPAQAAVVPMEDFIADVRLPLPHVWLGVSVEDQSRAEARLPWLLSTPAAVRFLSGEPLLGPLELHPYLWQRCRDCHGVGVLGPDGEACVCARVGAQAGHERVNRIAWVILGGESGPDARPCHLAWLRDLVRQCQQAEVPVFVKQLGRYPLCDAPTGVGPAVIADQSRLDRQWPPGTRFGNPTGAPQWHDRIALVHDAKGADPHEWPDDLRLHQFPRKEPRSPYSTGDGLWIVS